MCGECQEVVCKLPGRCFNVLEGVCNVPEGVQNVTEGYSKISFDTKFFIKKNHFNQIFLESIF